MNLKELNYFATELYEFSLDFFVVDRFFLTHAPLFIKRLWRGTDKYLGYFEKHVSFVGMFTNNVE